LRWRTLEIIAAGSKRTTLGQNIEQAKAATTPLKIGGAFAWKSLRLIVHISGRLLVNLDAVRALNAEQRFTRQITRRDGGG
jgi:hypothetical protein